VAGNRAKSRRAFWPLKVGCHSCLHYEVNAASTNFAASRTTPTNTMAPSRANTPTGDELDDILNNITQGRDIDGNIDEPTRSAFAGRPSGTTGDGLGIDEEIIITKKRIPIPKLDDKRLLSDPGIPRLRKISKDRLRFKGKGHEVCNSRRDPACAC
jgi:hypothetical protein